jgi:hypothetical protein
MFDILNGDHRIYDHIMFVLFWIAQTPTHVNALRDVKSFLPNLRSTQSAFSINKSLENFKVNVANEKKKSKKKLVSHFSLTFFRLTSTTSVFRCILF